MKKKELKHYRELLETKRGELVDRVRAARSTETQGPGEDAPDLGDRALTTTTREMSYRLSAEERLILKRIDKALARMDAGRYGTCLNCSGKIQTGRLEAVPWARYCIECQELLDRGEITDLDP